MNRLALAASLTSALPLLVACHGGERRNTGECPAGEVCSDLTPRGLTFHGNKVINDLAFSGPRATAIGGTQVVRLEYDDGDGFDSPLDIPYTADDDGGLGVKIESTAGENVMLRGVASRTNYLRIMDSAGELMDRKELAGAALNRMELVPGSWETIPAARLVAFAVGEREIGVALYGDVQTSNGPASQRIVDSSMQLTFPGALRTAWDTFEIDAVVGTYPLEVTAGTKPAATLDVVVVDGADAIARIDTGTTIKPNLTYSLCFEATNAGRYVAGLEWTFDIDGVTKVQPDGVVNRNCAVFSTTKTTGTVAFQARAGGQTMAMNLTVATARELDIAPDVKTLPVAATVEGDRAAM